MADLYLFNDLIYGDRPKVYTKPEFVKALNNYNIQAYLHPAHFPEAFQILHNAHDVKIIRKASGIYRLDGFVTSQRNLTSTELRHFKTQSDSWLDTLKSKEAYDGYINAMIQGNCLAHELKIPVYYEEVKAVHHPARYIAHNSRSNGGHGRVNHPQHTFASDNANARKQRRALQVAYPDAKIGHLNRRYKKNHPYDFPVFDDSEYIQGPYSTGWKHSTKFRHQWKGNNSRLDKRTLSHYFNDWTDYDDFEASGGDYYMPAWWYDLPDPNVTPMITKKAIDQKADLAVALNKNIINPSINPFHINKKPATNQ